MEKKPENNIPKSRLSRCKIIILCLCILIFAFLLISYGLRSSLYLKARLTPKLAELGQKVDGQFEFSDIRAMGITGLILTNVRFSPNSPDIEPITMDSVTVYPALLGMFIGDLNASRVLVQGLNAKLNLSDDSTPDIQWLKSLINSVDENQQSSVITNPPANPGEHTIPAMECQNCVVTANLGKLGTIRLDIDEQQADLDSLSQISLSGTPIKTCLSGVYNNDTCFKISLGQLRIADSIMISQLEFSDFAFSGVSFDSLLLQGIEVARNDQRNVLFVRNGQVESHISDDSVLSAFSGEYMFEFIQLEVLHERESNRLGVGIQLREPNGATARIFGGYSLGDNKFAVTFDTSQFDISRFLQKADFANKFRFDNFPVSGHISTIVELDEKRAWVEVDASVKDGTIYSPILAKDPLSEINAKAALKAWFDLSNRTFSIEDAYGTVGKIPFEMRVSRSVTADNSYQFDASLKSRGDSASFIPSLPKGFAPFITGYRLAGDYSIEMAVSYDEANIDALVLHTDFQLDNVETQSYDPRSDFNIIKGNAFKVQVNAATVPITIGPREPSWVTFYDLPRETAYTFVASEDGKFFSHQGFDIRAIRASLIADLKADKIVRGGSTISQQVVKNLFLNHDKTASRKFQEAFLTWQMEKTLPKLRIFELYLNLAHWARDTYGIRAAAQYYFQKNVQQLTLRESLFLAAILPNPIIFGGQYIQGKLSSTRLNKMINVGNALRSANRISAEAWEEAQPLIKEGIISDRPKPAPIQ